MKQVLTHEMPEYMLRVLKVLLDRFLTKRPGLYAREAHQMFKKQPREAVSCAREAAWERVWNASWHLTWQPYLVGRHFRGRTYPLETGGWNLRNKKSIWRVRCILPLVYGNCRDPVKRYYYDSTYKKCWPFTYQGCGGNSNNFWNLEHCERHCGPNAPCRQRRLRGPCHERHYRYYYDWDHHKCLPFTYGGCGGNANNFENYSKCKFKCGSTGRDD
ncbi:actinia tenebrosa protease inhibitors-like [Heteronotia binoei]|uniref:actinia tenebrosa protease inhibitors-like n=1 Tax=Heteronotia binoei TaxID=13085 RepID=UPI002931E07C|nr:actinia tenebrosa protease inhibitors-like [Heteronotia binoei]